MLNTVVLKTSLQHHGYSSKRTGNSFSFPLILLLPGPRGEIAQQEMTLAANLETHVLFLEPIGQEITDSYKLSSDLLGMLWHTCAHTYTQKYISK